MVIGLRGILGLFCTLVILSAHAETEEDGAFWLNVNAQGALPVEGLHWYAEVQPRWRQEGKHFDASILRPSLFYAVNDHVSGWFGYANIRFHPNGQSAREENRLWQQFLYKLEPIDRLYVQSRTRLEQRHFEHTSDTGHRLRQLFRISTPVFSSAYSLVFWDEYFIHLNDTDWGANRGFDQNRVFIGVNSKLDSQASIEVGYLNQFVNSRNVDKENHVFSTTLNLSF